jgi:hypothetical protein
MACSRTPLLDIGEAHAGVTFHGSGLRHETPRGGRGEFGKPSKLVGPWEEGSGSPLNSLHELVLRVKWSRFNPISVWNAFQ